MKRLIAYLMILVALFSVSVVPGFAVELPGESEIMPCYDYTKSVYADLSISESGTATATSKITGYPGITTKVSIYMYLEHEVNGEWEPVETWFDSTTSYSLTLEDTTEVESGHTYRIHASFYAYSGTSNEHITTYSKEISFN